MGETVDLHIGGYHLAEPGGMRGIDSAFRTNIGDKENMAMKKTIGCAMIVIVAAWLAMTGGAVGQSTAPASKPSTGPASQPAKGLTLDLGNKVTMKLVEIPAGKFMMGSPDSEKDRDKNEGPQNEVTITKPFYMGVYEVTQEQYEQIMGKNPSNFKGAQNPVELVSWYDAVEFCKALSKKTGKTVSLPTEAQWEYACRAGSKTRFYYGDDDDYGKLGDYAWYSKNGDGKTHPVDQKKPNDWGLYDMHGNVWEWCSDWYADSYANANKSDPTGPASGTNRVLRGGGWCYSPLNCRSAFRYWIGPGNRSYYVGFRVVVDLK